MDPSLIMTSGNRLKFGVVISVPLVVMFVHILSVACEGNIGSEARARQRRQDGDR